MAWPALSYLIESQVFSGGGGSLQIYLPAEKWLFLRLLWIRGKRLGKYSVEAPFTCSSPPLLGISPRSSDLRFRHPPEAFTWWVLTVLHQYLEAAEISCLAFQRPFCLALWPPDLFSFRIQQVSWRANEPGSLYLPSHWDCSPHSLHLCVSSPTRPPRPLVVTPCFSTAPAPRKTLAALTLYPLSANVPRENITAEVRLTPLHCPFLHNSGPCWPGYFNSSLKSLDRLKNNSTSFIVLGGSNDLQRGIPLKL